MAHLKSTKSGKKAKKKSPGERKKADALLKVKQQKQQKRINDAHKNNPYKKLGPW